MNRRGPYQVYIVQCADGTYYTGSTNDVARRMELHNAGRGAKYVRGRGPVRLVYVRGYRDHARAVQAEWNLKQLTRQQKEELMNRYQGEFR